MMKIISKLLPKATIKSGTEILKKLGKLSKIKTKQLKKDAKGMGCNKFVRHYF